MERFLFRAQRASAAPVRPVVCGCPGRAATLALFQDGANYYLYYETEVGAVTPEELFPDLTPWLLDWPGKKAPRKWVPLTEIFHYHDISKFASWRTTGEKKPWGRVIRLKPDHIASYVFYHYQRQEEMPGDGDQYGVIGLWENSLFFYSERPSVCTPPHYSGKLATKSSPIDQWPQLMGEHFLTPGEQWRDIPAVCYLPYHIA